VFVTTLVVVAMVMAATSVAAHAESAGRSATTRPVLAALGAGPAIAHVGPAVGGARAAGDAMLAAAPYTPPDWHTMIPNGIVGTLMSDGVCMYRGVGLACHDARFGWYNQLDDCYWNLTSPQHYSVTCETPQGLINVGTMISAQAPPGYNQRPSLTQAAAIAIVANLQGILSPTQATAPTGHPTRDPSTPGLVGLPAWMWAMEGKLISLLISLGPLGVNIKILGVTIAVALLNQHMEWDMGNGDIVNCSDDGQAFDPSYVNSVSPVTPSCSYTYQKPGMYSVDARSIWFVTVQSLAIPLFGPLAITVLVERSSLPQFLAIDELQVVTQ
jgi:hypothetical protein